MWLRILISLSLVLRITVDSTAQLFMIGDSVDLRALLAWCTVQNGDKYAVLQQVNKNYQTSPSACAVQGKSLPFAAAVHTYGSSPHGPYLHNETANELDPYIETVLRLPVLFQRYLEEFSEMPRIVSLHFIDWDSQFYVRNYPDVIPDSDTWNQILKEFEKDYRDRIADVSRLIGKNQTELILRAAASSPAGKDIVHGMNRVLKSLAKEFKLRLYDMDNDLWSTVDFNRNYVNDVFADRIHPTQGMLLSVVDKMLGDRFSAAWYYPSFYTPHGSQRLTYIEQRKQFINFFATKNPEIIVPAGNPLPVFMQKVILIGIIQSGLYSSIHFYLQENIFDGKLLGLNGYEKIFLYNQKRHSLHLIKEHETNFIFKFLRLGISDIFPIGESSLPSIISGLKEINKIPQGEEINFIPNSKMIVLRCKSCQEFFCMKKVYLFHNYHLRPIPNAATLEKLDIAWGNLSRVILSDDLFDYHRPHVMLVETPIPDFSKIQPNAGVTFELIDKKIHVNYFMNENYLRIKPTTAPNHKEAIIVKLLYSDVELLPYRR